MSKILLTAITLVLALILLPIGAGEAQTRSKNVSIGLHCTEGSYGYNSSDIVLEGKRRGDKITIHRLRYYIDVEGQERTKNNNIVITRGGTRVWSRGNIKSNVKGSKSVKFYLFAGGSVEAKTVFDIQLWPDKKCQDTHYIN